MGAPVPRCASLQQSHVTATFAATCSGWVVHHTTIAHHSARETDLMGLHWILLQLLNPFKITPVEQLAQRCQRYGPRAGPGS